MNRLIYSGNEENIELDVDVVDERGAINEKMVATFASRQRILYPISRERKSIPQLTYLYNGRSGFVGGIVPYMRIGDLVNTILSDVTFLVASGIPAVVINFTLNLSRHIADQSITEIFRDICEKFCHSTSGMFDIDVSHSTTSEENVLKRNIKLILTRRMLSFVWYENGNCDVEDIAKKLMVHIKNCFVRANLLAKYSNGTTEVVDSIDLSCNVKSGYISATNADGCDILITPYAIYLYGEKGYTCNYNSYNFRHLKHMKLYKALSVELFKDKEIMGSINEETYFVNISKEFTLKTTEE